MRAFNIGMNTIIIIILAALDRSNCVLLIVLPEECLPPMQRIEMSKAVGHSNEAFNSDGLICLFIFFLILNQRNGTGQTKRLKPRKR